MREFHAYMFKCALQLKYVSAMRCLCVVLLVTLMMCAICVVLDCYVSDVRSVHVAFDRYVRALPSVCFVLDCYIVPL